MFAGLFASIGAKLAATFIGQKVKDGAGFLASVPKPVWEGFTVVAYVLALLFLHQHYANAALKAADAAGYQRRADEDAKAIVELAAKVRTTDAQLAAIATNQRNHADEENRRTNADADALLVRGPGKATAPVCGGPVANSRVPAAASGPQPANRTAQDTGALLPGGDGQADRTIVSWRWLVGTIRQCDLDRTEALSWRNDYQARAKVWAQLKPPVANDGGR
jgi:hypothetical protein